VQSLQFGACEYVRKPFTAEELAEFVGRLLIKREARQDAQRQPVVHLVSPARAARLPAGHTGVAVVLADDAPAIGPGDVVDVVAAPEPFVDDAGSGEATVVARSAVVIDIHDDAVTLAVADGEATRVAQRALVGPVGLTVRRPVTGP
jgi:hypothetical protein